MSKSPKPKHPDPASLTFEEAMDHVEQIIDRIERGEIGLEQSLAEYERGVQLIQHCRTVHKQAVQQVDDLTQRLMGDQPAAAPQPASPDDDEDQQDR